MPTKKKAKKRAKTNTKSVAKKSVSTRKGLTSKKPKRSTLKKSPETRKNSAKTKKKARRPASGRAERISLERPRSRRNVQSGDLQGLSTASRAGAESVEELAEEGNSFEAGVVEGVEDLPNADQGGIRTREVPEDDVPEEYLDKDE